MISRDKEAVDSQRQPNYTYEQCRQQELKTSQIKELALRNKNRVKNACNHFLASSALRWRIRCVICKTYGRLFRSRLMLSRYYQGSMFMVAQATKSFSLDPPSQHSNISKYVEVFKHLKKSYYARWHAQGTNIYRELERGA